MRFVNSFLNKTIACLYFGYSSSEYLVADTVAAPIAMARNLHIPLA